MWRIRYPRTDGKKANTVYDRSIRESRERIDAAMRHSRCSTAARTGILLAACGTLRAQMLAAASSADSSAKLAWGEGGLAMVMMAIACGSADAVP